MRLQFAIDRGGTFTDVFSRRTDTGAVRVMKLLSVDPANYADAPREGIRRVLEAETGRAFPKDAPIDTQHIDWIRMGTTVATNALLERKGRRTALLVTKGFRDLLYIGNQARPDLFSLNIVPPSILYEEVVEIDERILLDDPKCRLDKTSFRKETALTREAVYVSKDLNEVEVRAQLKELLAKGIDSIAVVFMHSYMHPSHEERVGKMAEELGFRQISLSSKVMPMIRIVNRGFTATVDAYLTPCIKEYVDGFASGFRDQLRGVNVTFMQSDGGLTRMTDFCGSRAIISGPAGGVVGYARTTHGVQTELPVIGFDMGGTSTDVSRFAGEFDHVFESVTAGVTVQAPQLDVNTVAAGGGSMLFFRAGLFAVGPESAGAHPGPVCYKKGGPLTITDANLCLGRILPQHFPKIFGPNEDEPLDAAAARAAFESLAAKVNDFHAREGNKEPMSLEEVAMGFVRVANEAMCRPIRALTQGKGFDTSQHALACFGGAGGQHACAIARSLGMSEVFVHKYAGILSAYGMALADVVHEEQLPCAKPYAQENFAHFQATLDQLKEKCVQQLEKQGFPSSHIETQTFLHLRYDKTDCALMCRAESSCSDFPDYESIFLKRYQTEFGFTLKDRRILVDDVRVRGVGKTEMLNEREIAAATCDQERLPTPDEVTKVYFNVEDGSGSFMDTGVFMLQNLKSGAQIQGPAIVMDKLSTILVEPGCQASVNRHGNLKISVGRGQRRQKLDTTMADTVQLSIFSHRFMSIAEQMGRILQRTSISTNIKERLDFSCALFGPDGGLVSNAPHIPVHLGAMQDTVRHQMKVLGENLRRGDVILANHPRAGGSHLPDLTVITPVFYSGVKRPVFFVANRGHHADIGGISPGSMPPHSNFLWQEGARFKSFKIVDAGHFQEEELVAAFMEPGQYEGSSGSRCLQDNLSDLKAQIAANQKGIQLVSELIDIYGLDVVQAYMGFIQQNAEVAVREMLSQVGKRMIAKTGQSVLEAEDFMDDGSRIRLRVLIDIDSGSAVFDFAGTGPQVWGNTNAPRAVTMSALIYCLRCMIGQDVPLNQGCLEPVRVRIPEGCLLDPAENSAVVGGNVLTSQRVTDVVLRAFEACAASQGCCNNITFGDENFGYYETVAGGSGAGPTWHGRSGVHVHMTNTRLTDPEILERRYPVVLRRFCLARGTGGGGRFRGGDGVDRQVLFRKALTLSVLTERRVLSPYGMAGGRPGRRGVNNLVRRDGAVVYLGGKCSVPVEAGDVFCLQTPGGGGWGEEGGEGGDANGGAGADENVKKFVSRGSLHAYEQIQHSA